MSRLTHVQTGPYAPPEPRERLTAISADGSRLYVEVHGAADAPAVVLAHGWTCSTAFWAPVIRELSGDHRVIVYDQRGHGRSPAGSSPGGYSTTALADDLGAVLELALETGEQAVLVGHSMGGMTIMAAADRPYLRSRAAAAVLCSTGSARLTPDSRVFPVGGRWLRTVLHRALLVSRAPMGPVTPLAKRLIKYGTMGAGSAPQAVEACTRIVHACPRRVRAGWGRVLAALDLDAQVRRLAVPTAVIHGTADRLTPVKHARRTQAALPLPAGLSELAGLGHMTPMEAPEAVASVIRGLVKGHLTAEKEGRSEQKQS